MVSLCGCAPSQLASNVSGKTHDPLRGVGASFLAARAFDRAQVALQRDDSAALQRAGLDLRRASNAGFTPRLTGAFAAQLANEASQSAALANLARGEEMIDLLQASEGKYRAALAFAPLKSPEKVLDPITLNSLGYFLADRGTSRADFERAAILTRAAFRTWNIRGNSLGADALSRAQGPQDSLAWALFKLGKFEEARRQQEQVWNISRGMGAADATGEIPFHLAEIYRALGLKEKARQAYFQAMLLPSDIRTKAKIEGALRLLDLAQV
ncbi:hypothetical protein [Abditibacterium utsteinense]|uniref:hypothetical protein n=1 Tax=Abditibacterium utsteinense TaxID=1960156 RepID=UPI000F4A226A|nr:hypothetical protein [Abditibacterium utsteinense]